MTSTLVGGSWIGFLWHKNCFAGLFSDHLVFHLAHIGTELNKIKWNYPKHVFSFCLCMIIAFFLKVLFSLMKNEKTLFFFSMIQLVWHHQFHFLSDSSMFLLKSFKNFLKCNLCIAAVYKIFPLRYVLYILPYRKLFMEATSTISLSGSTYGPPDPSFILRSDKKSDIS